MVAPLVNPIFPRFVRLLALVVFSCGMFCGLAGLSASAAEPAWKVGEKIEVQWGGTWYPAVVLEVKDDKFKIHYEGYGSNWDEWVGADRIRASAAPAAPVQADDKWKVGDKVEAWNVTWYPAEIMVIGTDEHAGYYKVHYTGFSGASDQWLKADSIRAPQAEAKPAEAPGPRLGIYRVATYGAVGNPPLPLGEVELIAGGRYRARAVGGRLLGEGAFAFDAKTSAITWLSGPYKDENYGGGFEVSREGKTHLIRLRRGTIATNTIE